MREEGAPQVIFEREGERERESAFLHGKVVYIGREKFPHSNKVWGN